MKPKLVFVSGFRTFFGVHAKCFFQTFFVLFRCSLCGGRPSLSRGPDFLQVIILVLLNRAIVSLSTVTMMINRVDV